MGRYDQSKHRKSKRSRYGVVDDRTPTPRRTGNSSAFVVGILLIAAAAVGFFLAKMSDGVINVETLSMPLDLKKVGSLLPKAGQKEVADIKNQSAPSNQGQTDTLEFTKPPEQIILPSLDSSDEPVRQALLAVAPGLAPYLNTGQLIRKYMQIANDFSQGIRVAKHLDFLMLQQPFSAESNGNQLFIAAQSYQRYNNLAQAVNAIDVPAALAIYKKFRPLLLQVFAEFSYPDGHNLDDIFIKAAESVLSAPVIDKPVALVKSPLRYKFADPELEALNPVHKQMLRMGAENARLIQNKVRALVGELVNSAE